MKTSTKTVISINNISKVYEGPPPVRALDGVSLEIKEGDLIKFDFIEFEIIYINVIVFTNIFLCLSMLTSFTIFNVFTLV